MRGPGDDGDPEPALARAISARLRAASARDLAAGDLTAHSLSAAVAQLGAADAAYTATIGALLPPAKAGDLLAALHAFRSRVAALRAHVRAAANLGDFDPLDSYLPAIPGSHGETVRVSAAIDRAHAELDALRARLNDEITGSLTREEIERIVEAKRARNATFDRILRAALPPQTGDKLATQILLLADSWY